MPADTKPKPAAPPKPLRVIDHDHELVAARFSPCGRFVFGISYDANVYRWSHAGEAKTTLTGHQGWLQGLVFHPDGQRMYTADSWGGIRCWDYAADEPAPLWARTNAHPRWMRSLAISPDGALLATCGADRVVRLWNAADGSPSWETPPQRDDLMCLAFHPTDNGLIVGDLKGVVTHWDLAARKPLRQLDAKVLYLRPTSSGVPEINDVGGVRSLAFDPAGATLACAGSQPATSGFFTGKPTIVLLDWKTGERKQLLQWENADPAEGITLDVTWHPSGYLLAASSGQPGKGACYAWRPGEPAPFHLDKTITHCRSVSVHPDGRQFAVTQVRGTNGGNGRRLGKDGEYLGFGAQVRILPLPI